MTDLPQSSSPVTSRGGRWVLAAVVAVALLALPTAGAQADTGPTCGGSSTGGAASCAITYTCAASTCTVQGSTTATASLVPLYLAGSVVVKAPAGTSSGTCSTTLGATCSAASRGAVTLRHGESAVVTCTATPLLGLGGARVSCGSTVTAVFAVNLRAHLDGTQITPPAPTPATAEATIGIDPPSNTVCWHIEAQGLLGAPTAVLIHHAPRGITGPTLNAGPLLSRDFDHCYTQTAVPPASLSAQDIAANPSGFYLAIHTSRFPAGEVRGQLEATSAAP